MKIYWVLPFILHTLFRKPLHWLFKVFINIKVRGLDNLGNVKGPVIFASNHVSELDALMIGTSLPFFTPFNPIFYVARSSKYYDPKVFGWRSKIYGGLFFKCWGAYPAYSGQKRYEYSLKHFLNFLNDKNSVCIFPEGKLTKNGDKHKIHGGAAYLSYVIGAPIVPVQISGADSMSSKDFWSRRRHVAVTYGEPIYSKDLFGDTTPMVNETQNDFQEKAREVVDIMHKL